MEDFLKMLSNNLSITTLVIVPIGILLIGLTTIYITAFFQGRSISFYPPKIGEQLIEQGFFCKFGQEHPQKKINQNLQNSNTFFRSTILH